MRFPSKDSEFEPLLKNMVDYCFKNREKLGLQRDTVLLLQDTYSGWAHKYNKFKNERTDLNRQAKNGSRQLLESVIRMIIKRLSDEMREL